MTVALPAPHVDEQWFGSLRELLVVLDSGLLGKYSEAPLSEEGGVRMGCPVRPGEGHSIHALERRADHVELVCDHGCAEEVVRAKLLDAHRLAAAPDRLLDELAAFVRRYVVLSDAQASVIALWIVHTHATDAADATPYLGVTSAEKRSGKTRLLEVAAELVARPLATANISDAALFRSIEQDRPTLLFDEIDAIFGPKARDREDLRGMINAGHRRGAEVRRVGGPSRDRLDTFRVFAPKALAGIGKLPETVADRCIPVRLELRAPGERVARLRRREFEPVAHALRKRVAEFAEGALAELAEVEPELPDGLDDRAQDGGEPLLAIAELAGGEWIQRSRDALLELHGAREVEDDSVGIRLLSDVRAAFEMLGDRVSTAALLEHLHGLDEAPWGEWYGKPLSARGLIKLLGPYRVRSRSVRLDDGSTPKGYRRDQFEEVWTRYLPATARSIRHNATTRMGTGIAGDSKPPQQDLVADSEEVENPQGDWDVAAVADRERNGWTAEAADTFLERAREVFPGSSEERGE